MAKKVQALQSSCQGLSRFALVHAGCRLWAMAARAAGR